MEAMQAAPAVTPERVERLKGRMRQAVRAFRITEAEDLCRQLVEDCGVDPDHDDMLPSRVTIEVLSGRLREAMCLLNGLGEDRALGLKAVCLRLLRDPFWEGTAMRAQSDTNDPALKESMQLLLDTAYRA